MSKTESVLEFCEASFRFDSGPVMEIADLSLNVAGGALVTIEVEKRENGVQSQFFDLAEGLIPPDRGKVKFLGESWEDMSQSAQSRMRGMIGRVFDEHGWVSNLSLYENIALSQRHHTSRGEPEIERMVGRIVEAAGLNADLSLRPENVGRRDLRKAQWARAFMGEPRLVLMEYPEEEVTADDAARLRAMAAEAVAGGTAVIWMSSDPAAALGERTGAAWRLTLDGKLTRKT